MQKAQSRGGFYCALRTYRGTVPPVPGHTLDDLRAANRRAVTSALGDMGPMSRADLVRATGLSATTISSLVADLIESGAVAETDDRARPHKGGSGRPPVLVALAVRPGQVAGIDIGHHHVRVAVADRAGTILAEDQTETDTDSHGERTLEQAFSLLERVVASTGGRVPDLVWAGLCVPGPIDRRSSRLDGGVLPGWRGMAPGVEMQERLGIPVAVDNDANLGAVAEHRQGAAEGASDLIYVKVASGLGAGLVLAGRLHRGATGIAGEVGHVPVRDDGLVCRCGARGCLETEVSALRLLEMLRPAYGDLDVTGLLALDAAADPGAQRVLNDAGHAIGRSLAGLCTVLNPDVVVIGGSLGASDSLVRGVQTAVEHFAQPDAAAAVDVRPGRLGHRAELVGAVALAIARAEQYPLRG